MRNIYSSKGFTLTEILIVIIMIGILSSLLLPRLIGQTEKAVAAEAVDTIGALKRAQEQFRDASANNTFFDFDDHCNDVELIDIRNNLGLDLATSCTAATRRWQYSAETAGVNLVITATRVNSAANVGTITFSMGPTATNNWNGTGAFQPGTRNWPLQN